MTHLSLIIIAIQSIVLAVIMQECQIELAKIESVTETQKIKQVALQDANNKKQQFIFPVLGEPKRKHK